MKKRTCMGMIATTMSLTLVLSACQSSKTASNRGGTLTIAAWEPDCADPLLSCSATAWEGAFPTMTSQTVPRVFDSRNGHSYVPSALLAGAPTLSAGPPQTVTYHINRKAKWSDGQPITSSDFRFTWQSVIHEKDVIDPTGYDQIKNIDDSDPAT
ncbi:MAG TPA: ABC transporter substrate-binding protein, partial [Acidimicrobiales bacterium]|nr:ABC transporter substrate-binding protein [Acidimicrobiales bacterium]